MCFRLELSCRSEWYEGQRGTTRDNKDAFRCLTCAGSAWAARGSGRSLLISSSSLGVLGFYQPVSGWPLPATVTGLLSSLIHWLSSPQSSGCRLADQGQSSPVAAQPSRLSGDLSRAWCRTGGLWVRLSPRRWRLRWWMSRRAKPRGPAKAAPSPRRLRYRLPRHHPPGRRITRDRGSSSTPSWLTGVPQAGSTGSPTSGSCTARSPKSSASRPQR